MTSQLKDPRVKKVGMGLVFTAVAIILLPLAAVLLFVSAFTICFWGPVAILCSILFTEIKFFGLGPKMRSYFSKLLIRLLFHSGKI